MHVCLLEQFIKYLVHHQRLLLCQWILNRLLLLRYLIKVYNVYIYCIIIQLPQQDIVKEEKEEVVSHKVKKKKKKREQEQSGEDDPVRQIN